MIKWILFLLENQKASQSKQFDKEDMIYFHKMLLKMKKKRPKMEVDRIMKLLYGERYSQ